MGLLKIFSRTPDPTARPHTSGPPAGALLVNRAGHIVASSLPTSLARSVQEQIGRAALQAFAAARRIQTPLTTLETDYRDLKLTAIELRGGALIFLNPGTSTLREVHLPAMSNPTLDEFILYLETYIECWKQFNHYVNLARQGSFSPAEESEFLEVKSLITQGLEVLSAAVEQGVPKKEEVLSLISAAPSLRFLSQHENNVLTVESQWHRVYLSLQSLLGRLKVQQQKEEGEWSWGSLFGRGER